MGESSNRGVIRIADDVIAVISGIAALESEGIYGMSGGITEGLAKRVMGKNVKKGIRVEVNDSEAIIDLKVIVQYGVKIDDACKKLQKRVKDTVEIMTGLDVHQVNIHVEGVHFMEEVKA